MLLQAAGWAGQFRMWMESSGANMRASRITSLAPKPGSIEEAVHDVAGDLDSAASRIFHLAADPAARRDYLNTAIRLAVTRADEVHYIKYLSALIEDSANVSPEWRSHMLAATAYYMKSPRDAETKAVARARSLLPA
jgi:DNA-binding ferritin-like protein